MSPPSVAPGVAEQEGEQEEQARRRAAKRERRRRVEAQQKAAAAERRAVALAPLFAPAWAFEVEAAQLRRVLGHAEDAADGGRRQEQGQEQAPRRRTVGCVEDRARRQASGLLAADYRFDLVSVPDRHRRFVTRVFRIPHACRDLGWLAHSQDVRRAIEAARRSCPPGGAMPFCLKISAFPKNLEFPTGEVLLEGGCVDERQLSPSASHASHVLHVCHCPGWSPLFYFGLTRSARLEAALAAAEVPAPAADGAAVEAVAAAKAAEDGPIAVGPAVGNAAYAAVSSRSQAAKRREKAALRFEGWEASLPADRQDEEEEEEGQQEDAEEEAGRVDAAGVPAVSRAYFKMQEVWLEHLASLGLQDRDWSRCRALDMGAAPGGWTQFLSDKVARVLSVDGGLLHPAILRRPTVRHALSRIQDPPAAAAMEEEGPFDLVCTDVNLPPQEAAELMARHIFPHLRDGALLILTLKFPRQPTAARIDATLADLRRILCSNSDDSSSGVSCPELRVVWLHANSSNERTVLAVVRRRQGS